MSAVDQENIRFVQSQNQYLVQRVAELATENEQLKAEVARLTPAEDVPAEDDAEVAEKLAEFDREAERAEKQLEGAGSGRQSAAKRQPRRTR